MEGLETVLGLMLTPPSAVMGGAAKGQSLPDLTTDDICTFGFPRTFIPEIPVA